MKKLDKESKTAENLAKGFFGEGGARNRYTYFSKAAKKEGYVQISNLFLETADNEKEHAKRFLKYLGEDFLEIEINNAKYPVGLNNKTENNLNFAIKGEHEENTILYPEFAKIAQDEGYNEIAENISEIIEAEKAHEARFIALLENIKNESVFKKEKDVIWKCINCGYLNKSKEAPLICPSCHHKQEYFEVFMKNY